MADLKTVVVGLNMGRNHARVFHACAGFELVAVCDLLPDRVSWVQENVSPCKGYDDYETMLKEIRPDVVVVATPNNLHSSMTKLAVKYGVKGVYCEKPVALSMQEAREMADCCHKAEVALMIGHQRRLTPVYQTMKRLIDEGAIGDVYLIRGTCAGDFLSDGSHTVDSVRYLVGDAEPRWLLGAIYRDPIGTPLYTGLPFDGFRYGHQVDSGAFAVTEFSNGVRAEMLTGGMWFPKRTYQDFEIFGTKGRLWRAGDDAEPELLIQDFQSGGFRSVPVDRPEADGSLLDGGGHGANLEERILVVSEFRRMILEGFESSMGIDNAIKTHEMVMAVYESARTNTKVTFPLEQDQYPLDLMLQEGLIK